MVLLELVYKTSLNMLYKYTDRLKQINYHIKHKSTGCPAEFAKKLGITVRAWYKWRDTLINDLGLPIVYCPFKKTYYYKEEGTFEMGFRKIPDNGKFNINGGFSKKWPEQVHPSICHFYGFYPDNL
jgi:hypothetical protein